MKKETDHEENLTQVDRMERQVRRARKMERKVKQVRQARRQLKREELDLLMLVLVLIVTSCAVLSSCSAVKKQDYRSERDSVMLVREQSSLSERRAEAISSLFESLSWEEDRQTALIRSDSSLIFQPDGSLHLQRGSIILSSARRQESAVSSSQEREDVQGHTLRIMHQEQAEFRENVRELEKKKPPGAMLLLPALVMAFAFLVLIRKVRN